jgi:two-component system, chemotaxis family, chemotaxis protein CheY
MATLFIIEDNDSSRILCEKLLTMKGHKVLGTAENGVEAVEFFKSSRIRPDVIIMDHRMPLKNGIEVMKEIRQIDNEAKVIFISADIQVKAIALSAGAVDFIQKPFSINLLLDSINHTLIKD